MFNTVKLIFGVCILCCVSWLGDKKHREELFVLLDATWCLFLSDIYVYGCASEVPALTNLILEEAFVGLLHILRQVGKEHERGHAGAGKLHTVLDLDILTLV